MKISQSQHLDIDTSCIMLNVMDLRLGVFCCIRYITLIGLMFYFWYIPVIIYISFGFLKYLIPLNMHKYSSRAQKNVEENMKNSIRRYGRRDIDKYLDLSVKIEEYDQDLYEFEFSSKKIKIIKREEQL